MRKRGGSARGRAGLTAALVAAGLLITHQAWAYISQVDGTVVPQTTRMQQCLDRPGTGETAAGAVSAVADAAVLPEAYRPVEDPAGSGNYPVTFSAIGEGAGYRNSFGWYWTDEDPSDPANLHTVFGCRPVSAACSCPCNPENMRPGGAWQTTLDFSTQPGFAPGRAIGFWLRTPERIDGSGNDSDNCGDRTDTANRIYFTSKALNDDGDYVHFLVYRSATRTNTYYFGFEDLFRGGDNDFEDMLVRASGLVPLCDPQPETCNGADDDCDMAVDEGVTTGCSTACGSGIRECVGGSFGACSAPTPTGESCNGMDDDCDGTVDEGLNRACSNECGTGTEVCSAGAWVDCTAPTPGIESCNNLDDDCDGTVDEGITRACFAACGSGTETCVAGAFVGCDAPTPSAETCNGTDDDCDGLTDEGLTRACSTVCGDGTETCISGSYVGCTAPDPALEACNGIDDDCDGTVDEGLTRTCSTACGTGTETCVAGAYVGCDAPTPSEEVCNNVDDDCNGVIDDGNPGGGDACLPDDEGGYTVVDPDSGGEGGICIPGRVRCVAGELECLGASSPTREICNCEDDDCDGEVDEDVTGSICPGGACIGCTCASPCEGEEFPCPPGRECDESLAVPDEGIIGYCVPGMCAGVECTDEEVCDPATGECTNLCEGRTCPDGTVCVRGGCVEDNCYGRGCDPGERCRMGECEPDPCLGVTCDGDAEYCRDGDCVRACATPCSALERCVDGECVPTGCASSCGSSATCVDGECVPDDCAMLCGRGRTCVAGDCVDDPCKDIECPGATVCDRGACVTEGEIPEPEDASYGLATGGGGCVCAAAGAERSDGTGMAGGLLALAGLLVLVGWRRRWRLGGRGLSLLAVASVIGLGPVNAGCEVDPFCFEDCDEPADAGPSDTGVADARPADGCVVSGEEICNGVDDDCNGIVDDGFDLQRDPRNCGACGNECVLPHAFPDCEVGECAIARCEIGWHDLDGNPTNGCEYECPPSGSEICDDRDNDCDGATDEGFDLDADLAHCGECGNLCSFPNASATCEGGTCTKGDCNAGFVDLDGDPDTGCEYACTPTGAETCNSVDDDCDGMVDEGFDLTSDPSNCGVCGRSCTFPNATGECVAGACGIASCAAGFVDVDGDPSTGCEYECTPTGSADTCNGDDDDCDGAVDEADPDVGSSCGSATGACELGVRACQFGSLVCVGGRGPTAETCNGVDDDCDGDTDESVAGAPIPGVGVRCGETNEGACEYGVVVCSGGALVCGGGYVPPATETCNGVDDDCDGAVDDSPTPPSSTPASCTATAGECAGRTPVCNGGAGWQCSFPATYQPVETLCDMLDNDCDGMNDEGCLFPGPGGDVRVDRGDTVGSNNSVQPTISGDGATRVYAAWMDLRGGSGRAHVLFNRSTNGGDTWGASPTQLDSASGAAIGPALAVTGSSRDDVSAVWADFRGGSSYREIYQSFSTDFGASWDANTRINPGQNVDSFNVDLAAQGSNVYVVYESFSTPRTRHVFIARSPDGGDTWGAPQQVDTGVGSTFVAATPKVAAAGGFVHVTWRDNRNGALDVFYRRAAAMGANSVSFGASETRLDVGTAAGASTSFSPVVAAEGANVYVAWVDDRSGSSFDIRLNRSNDSGANWLAADSILLDDDSIPHDSIDPRIVAPSSGTAIVSWIDYRYGFPDILASRTTDSGSSFSSPVRVDTGTGNGTSASLDLALGANGDLVVATWADDRDGFFDIYANFSLDGGATWQPDDYRMDSTAIPGSSDSVRPQIYVAPAAAHILWVDHRNGANADIYYRRLD